MTTFTAPSSRGSLNSRCAGQPTSLPQTHLAHVLPWAHTKHLGVVTDASFSCLSNLVGNLANSSRQSEPTHCNTPLKGLPTFSLTPHSLSSEGQFSTARVSLPGHPLKPCSSISIGLSSTPSGTGNIRSVSFLASSPLSQALLLALERCRQPILGHLLHFCPEALPQAAFA